jgi:histidyl-tRNA synthetase
MMKPSLPKGTRDFLPGQAIRRQYIFNTIRSVFEKYGYAPIETPAMEALQTLTGKYGEEGDKLLFKILNNGDYLQKADETALNNRDSQGLISSIAKRGLRYDLTVPFARFVTMHQNDIHFPFKRYQIQPVWRADRPQKGRYQEFFQCDADVVGSQSLLYEAEFIQIYDSVFKQLGLPYQILINNRKILAGLAERCGISDLFMEMTIAIDKLDKIGISGVKDELSARGIQDQAIESILSVLEVGDDLASLKTILKDSALALQGIKEVELAVQLSQEGQGIHPTVKFDVTLARGLNYYTGCIFEVKALGVQMGSIGGGGRYDDLTASFGLSGTPGVGISFGAERIYDVMEELRLFPSHISETPKVIFLTQDDSSLLYGFKAATYLRSLSIAVDIYPEPSKMKKQFKYASDRGFKYAVIVGEEEVKLNLYSVKDLESGEQSKCSLDQVVELLTSC